MTGRYPSQRMLEPNVLNVGGQLRVLAAVKPPLQATTNLAAVFDLTDDAENLDLSFTQFHPMPGGQVKFCILHDDVSGLYWMNATLPTRSQEQDPQFNVQLKQDRRYDGTSGNERRILALYCSFDALNWLPAGYICVWPLVRQASNYCGLLIDGDDLLVAARTSREGHNQHDNDLTTFHRVRNFRERAAALMPAEGE